MKHKSTYETYLKRLGELDKERRALLRELKGSPEYSLKHLANILDGFIKDNADRWFYRQNEKNLFAYFKLVSYEFQPIKAVKKITRSSKTEVMDKIALTKNKAALTKLKLTWKLYNYGSVMETSSVEEIEVSIFNEIKPQILNGRKEATDFNEKTFLKAQLTEKEKELKAELKRVQLEIATIK